MALDDIVTDRRSFLKGVGATSVVTVGGLAAATSVGDRSASSALQVEGRKSGTSYHVTVNDPTASARSTEEGGSVTINHASDLTQFEGSLGAGDVHTFAFDGDISRVYVADGHAEFDVDGGFNTSKNGSVKVWKTGFYHFVAAGSVEPARGVDNEDSGAGNLAQGAVRSDDDRYAVVGDLTHVELRSTVGDTVALRHTFGKQ